jgi:hypothetical protein
MPDLERHFLNLAGHLLKLRENKAIDNSASEQMSRIKLARTKPPSRAVNY